MFSSGSKYFLGIAGISLVASVVYAFTVNPSDLGPRCSSWVSP